MYESGTTACCVLFNRNSKNLICVNVGDSRAVIGLNGGKTEGLSVDHKPWLEKEKARIEAAGFTVDGDGRINGLHSFSRAVGDADMKQDFTRGMGEQAIIVNPEYKWVPWGGGKAEFVVIGCDGLWDVMKNEEVVQWAKSKVGGERGVAELEEKAKELAEHAIAVGSTDNVSVCIVLLPI